ncbi:MAG: hypothetical protein JSW34_12005 [Candidatus Zixiibacteriota bacterium]|nr:MAG: hypothetical protein JSW34_12005 [candidate division Zixibacteria bacterium]
MFHRYSTITFILSLLLVAAFAWPRAARSEAIVADHAAAIEFDLIPSKTLNRIQADCHPFFGHTSHGSQLMTGLSMLESEDALYQPPEVFEFDDDLGDDGYIGWVQPTRDYLDAHTDCNLVIWSWCGGCSVNDADDTQVYLDAMSALEADYASVTFVYMTGHLDGTGVSGTLYANNNRIREYCTANDKVLYDFADIESFDPDGNYYPDASDACEWCDPWCSIHDCPACSYCAHSHCFNCYQKGKAFWWLMARIFGWAGTTDIGDGDPTELPDGFALRQNRPNPFNPSTTIEFRLPFRADVSVAVYNVKGERVATLVDGSRAAGTHYVVWDGRDGSNHEVASGVYFCRMNAERFEFTRKMLLLK